MTTTLGHPGARRSWHGTVISDATFALLRDLIRHKSGILLSDGKAPLMVGRLAPRLRALGLESYDAYYRYVIGGEDPDELVHMLDCISTNETQFFREPRQFEFLEKTVYPEWRRQANQGRRPRRVRVWSAACSTGEEAYSLAMSLLWHFPVGDGWDIDVLATDLSTSALEVARAGVWSVDRARHVPHRYLQRYMRRGTRAEEGRMRATPELRASVRLGRVNLHDAELPPGVGRFDLVLCRNVLIYFAESDRAATLGRLAGRVEPGGYLLLGHAENPGRALSSLESVRTMIYRAPPTTGSRT